jgi:phage-related baseplate assembly protein
VSVLSPIPQAVDITATVDILNTANQVDVLANVDTALTAYVNNVQSRLGKDIIISEIIAAIQAVQGVYSVTISEPASDVIIAANEWPQITSTIILGTTNNVG